MEKNISILLIDDDEDDRDLFVEAVAEVDDSILCTTVNGCESAMARLNDSSTTLPDYIFLDLRMPKISGRKCLQMIRTDQRFSLIPIIMYTTSTDERDAEELRALGATHFTSKPTNPEEIYYIVSMILNEQWN